MQKYKLQNIMNGGRIDEIKADNVKCSKFPDLPSIVTSDRSKIDRIIAIGDIHGDLDLGINCLLVADLIERVYEDDEKGLTVNLWYKDEKVKRMYKWIGEKTIVVQVGDQVDRCRPLNHECHVPVATFNDESSDVTIMFFYHDLHIVALKVDCALYSLLGNHELLNVLGNMKYVSYKGLMEFPSKSTDITQGRAEAFALDSKQKTFRDKASLSEFLACTRLSSMIIDKYLFVHAGLMEKLIQHTQKLDGDNVVLTINNIIRGWLLDNNTEKDKVFIMKLLAGKSLSPFWPRVFGNIKRNVDMENSECQKHVKPVLDLLNLEGIVVGHTPQIKHNITSACSSKVWRVDIAGSQAFDEVLFEDVKTDKEKQAIQKGRVPQVLEIILGKEGEKDSFNLLPKELNYTLNK